jgi:hypothetical protein
MSSTSFLLYLRISDPGLVSCLDHEFSKNSEGMEAAWGKVASLHSGCAAAESSCQQSENIVSKIVI